MRKLLDKSNYLCSLLLRVFIKESQISTCSLSSKKFLIFDEPYTTYTRSQAICIICANSDDGVTLKDVSNTLPIRSL